MFHDTKSRSCKCTEGLRGPHPRRPWFFFFFMKTQCEGILYTVWTALILLSSSLSLTGNIIRDDAAMVGKFVDDFYQLPLNADVWCCLSSWMRIFVFLTLNCISKHLWALLYRFADLWRLMTVWSTAALLSEYGYSLSANKVWWGWRVVVKSLSDVDVSATREDLVDPGGEVQGEESTSVIGNRSKRTPQWFTWPSIQSGQPKCVRVDHIAGLGTLSI